MTTGPQPAASHSPELYPGTTLFGTNIESILFVTYDGTIKEANPAFCKMLGYEKRDLIGRNFTDFIHPEDLPTSMAEFSKLRFGLSVLLFDNRWKCKGGTWKWLSWKAEPKPEHKMVIAVASDITDRREVLGKDVETTLTYVVEKLHAMDYRTRQFEGELVKRAGDSSSGAALGSPEDDAAKAGINQGYRWVKWAFGFLGATGGVIAAIFLAGKTYQREIGNNATKDDIAVHTKEELAPVVKQVNDNTKEIATVKYGVETLVSRSDAEAKVRQAQRVVDKYQKERDEELQEWAAEKAAGRTRRRKPQKRKELIEAELALGQAQTDLLKTQ